MWVMNYKKEKGSALVLAMVFVGIFGSLAVGYLAAARADLGRSQMVMNSRRAHLAAESGLDLARDTLPDVKVRRVTNSAEAMAALVDKLNSQVWPLRQTGEAVLYGETIVLPPIALSLGEGEAEIRVAIASLGGDVYRVTSGGAYGDCRQTLTTDFRLETDMSVLLDYGVASRAPVGLTGNARLVGANMMDEGSVLSTSYVEMDAVDVIGHVYVSGDAAVTNPDGAVSLKGDSEIGGDIRIGVEEPDFPEIDTSQFEPFATTTIDSSTNTDSLTTLENVRIAANTNPVFSSDTTIRGVVYIESPNEVHFAGQADVTGVIVVEPPGGTLHTDSHKIKFSGGVTSTGVEGLPSDDPAFTDLRAMTGSFLLAPGYYVEFTGNFASINGSVAASRISLSGTAQGYVLGSVLNIDDTRFDMSGDSQLVIDHSRLDRPPAGMVLPQRLIAVEGTYDE